MGDCANFEHAFSHTVHNSLEQLSLRGLVLYRPADFQLANGFGSSLGSSDFICNRYSVTEMAGKLSKKHMNARLELAEGIQECLETVQDIKACNQEEDYLRKLDAKMDAAEKAQISSEMTTASLLTTGQMFLRLGLATVIVVGNSLVVSGDTSLFTYILFLIAASRLYDPLSGAMSNMAELFSV